MTEEPHFISIEDALYFHDEEIKCAGGATGLRKLEQLDAAVNAPKATFGGNFLYDLFEMAATYIDSICTNHPFIDGNKRTGAACALTFLAINGYEIEEQYDEEIADKVLSLVKHEIDKSKLVDYFRKNSKKI
jgi:death-on-curing protein